MIYEFDKFRLDPSERRLLRGNEQVALTAKVFDILTVLVENSGHLLEKDELIKTIWPDTAVEEGNLTRYVSTLRKALGENGQHQFIETVPRRGYRFIADVSAVEAEEGNSVSRKQTRPQVTIVQEEETKAQRKITAEIKPDAKAQAVARVSWRMKRQVLIACATMIVTIPGMAYWWKSIKTRQAGTNAQIRSIAVLPFKQLSAGDGNEVLGLGMADVLITRLGSLNQITVRPTSAVFNYTSGEQDLASAGRDLRVESVLDGSIQKLDGRIRVTARLVRVQDGSLMWADTFDGRSADIFAVQDAISERLASALALNPTGNERKLLTKRYTESAEAYQAYMKGRYFWNKRTGEGLKKAIEYFEDAIKKDPNYGLAHAGLADSYALLGDYGVVAPQEAFPKMKAAATRAVEIDDQLAEAHTSLAYAKILSDWDWSGAEEEFKRAIELNYSYATAHHWYSEYLAAVGRFDEALEEAKRAEELDPQSLIINTNLGWILYLARRYDEAIEEFKKTLEMEPSFFLAGALLWQAYVKKGMYDEAMSSGATKLDTRSPEQRERYETLRKAYDTSGWKGFRRKEFELDVQRSKAAGISPYATGLLYVELGENDLALKSLEKAYEGREVSLRWLKVDPFLDGVRSDPRFVDLLRRMGLAD